MKIFHLICFVPLVIGFVLNPSVLNISGNHFQWIKRGVEHVRRIAAGSLDVVLLDDPSSRDVIRSIFYQLRQYLSSELVVKIESLKGETLTRKRMLYVVDGSTLKLFVVFCRRDNQRRKYK